MDLVGWIRIIIIFSFQLHSNVWRVTLYLVFRSRCVYSSSLIATIYSIYHNNWNTIHWIWRIFFGDFSSCDQIYDARFSKNKGKILWFWNKPPIFVLFCCLSCDHLNLWLKNFINGNKVTSCSLLWKVPLDEIRRYIARKPWTKTESNNIVSNSLKWVFSVW